MNDFVVSTPVPDALAYTAVPSVIVLPTWADFLRSQADSLLACDFIETTTLSGQRQYILAVIEHASRCVRVLGTTARPPRRRQGVLVPP